MIIKIYQINHERDVNRLMFMSWEWWNEHGFTAPDREAYDMVYEYESDTANLEKIFRIFNHDHPEDYTARSVSVSDIVETPNGLFFCDRVGWQPVRWKEAHDE